AQLIDLAVRRQHCSVPGSWFWVLGSGSWFGFLVRVPRSWFSERRTRTKNPEPETQNLDAVAVRLRNSAGAGSCALSILRARAARDADRANDLAVDDDRHAAVYRYRAVDTEHAQPVATSCQHFLKRFRRAFEPCCRTRLVDGHRDAACLRRIHSF